jgi:uncharacterized membrane protein
MKLTQDTIFSLVRTVLTLIGSFLLGKAFLGNILTADVLQTIIGAVLTAIGVVWGIASKSATVESIQSGVRSVLIVFGGFLVAAGKIKDDTLQAFLGLIPVLMTIVQSYTSKIKVQQIADGSVVADSTTGQVIKAPLPASVPTTTIVAAVTDPGQPVSPLPPTP